MIRRGVEYLARLIRQSILKPNNRWRRRRLAIAELQGMDDRMLADLGLLRSQIELAVDGMIPRRKDAISRPVSRNLPAENYRNELPLAA